MSQVIQTVLRKCRDDPNRFNDAVLRRSPYWSRQCEICRSLVRYRITVVYSGNAVGKNYLIGGVVPWWLYTRVDSLAILTGPSQTVLGSVTWKEIRRAVESSRLPVPRISSGIKASPAVLEISPGWHALGYSTTSVERASGQHAGQLLVVADEASGIEDDIWDALDSLNFTKMLALGNPIRSEGRFIDLIHQAEKDKRDGIEPLKAVNAIQIPSTESPHADLEHSPVGMADKTWLESCYRQYGKDSFWVRSHIKAEIPDVSADDLIPTAWLDYATSVERPVLPPNHPVHRTRRIAIDLGEGVGRDCTALLVRDNLGILELISGNALSLPSAASEAARLSRIWNVPAERISYDKLGIGRDFNNHLRRVGLGGAVGYAGSGRPQDPKAFVNIRIEAAWKARRRLNPDWSLDTQYPQSGRQPPFHIPARAWWPLLREDIEAMSYDLVGNKTRLIAKERLLEILGRSPDRGDAFIQSWAFD